VLDDIVSAFNWFRDLLYQLLKTYQGITEPVLGTQSYWVAIVMLTLTIRVILIPLVARQVRSQRAMAELAPELRKLQQKYKDDRQRLNQEMMALYQERGVNPFMGCLPLFVQLPFFLALYQVIFQRRIAGEDNILLDHGFFGIPLNTVWWQLDGWFERLLTVEGVVILLLILAQAAVMFFSMRQMMAKQSAATAANPQAQQMQQTMMRVMPLMLGVVGVNFPLAVLIYWVTTNLWQWGQQTVMLRTHPIKTSGDEGQKSGGKTADAKKATDAKSGKDAAPAKKGGPFASLLSTLTEGAGAQRGDAAKNGSQSKDDSRSKDGARDRADASADSDGAQPGAERKPGSGTTRRRGSGGRKTTSPRSGGGKGGAGSRQRRRKR
jgi:YidC/Oxa1 family membrane protein insertase